MIGWKKLCAAAIAIVVLTIPGFLLSPVNPASGAGHPATGVGSCTLKGWNPGTDPADAKDLPVGDRHQTYRPDDYNCTGAKFAAPGVEFAKFPQPRDFHVNNVQTTRLVRTCQAG